MLTAALADTHHHSAVAARMLARYEPQPGRQVPAVFEVRAVPDCRYHGSRRFRPNPTDLGNPLAIFAGLEDLIDLAIESPDAFVDLEHEGIQDRDDLAHQLRELVIRRGQNRWNQPPDSGGRNSDRAITWYTGKRGSRTRVFRLRAKFRVFNYSQHKYAASRSRWVTG